MADALIVDIQKLKRKIDKATTLLEDVIGQMSKEAGQLDAGSILNLQAALNILKEHD